MWCEDYQLLPLSLWTFDASFLSSIIFWLLIIYMDLFVQGQLFQLMQRLGNTTPHFIRCIKPNNVQSPGLYEQGLVLQQLRCCGVLEVVRISRSGFPTRVSHQKFARRWRCHPSFISYARHLTCLSSNHIVSLNDHTTGMVSFWWRTLLIKIL